MTGLDERVRDVHKSIQNSIHFVLERFEEHCEKGHNIGSLVHNAVSPEINGRMLIVGGYVDLLRLKSFPINKEPYDAINQINAEMESVLKAEWTAMVDAARAKGKISFSELKKEYLGKVSEIYTKEFLNVIAFAVGSAMSVDSKGNEAKLDKIKTELGTLPLIFQELKNLNNYFKAGSKKEIIYCNQKTYQNGR